ncbi:MAG: methyltransferase domain-containing protein [Rhodobacteraceae bacterium]|nr:methyltransferase domain-containing protein [Paracoccaceae bacterium]
MTEQDLLYDDSHIRFLEDIWGEGYLSPGGAEEAASVVAGLDLSGKRVLDIGCGSGAISVLLAAELGAGEVIGIDVEAEVCAAARKRVAAAGLADRVTIRQVEPGPFDFPDQSFDLVYSKDSIIHIPDKEALALEVFRVLRPGGWFAASDWLIAHDDEPSDEMKAYIAAEDLEFAMASPVRYRRALLEAGFAEVNLTNRNEWYFEVATAELAWMTGPERARLDAEHGADFMAEQEATWRAMIRVLESGEHCPHHLRARRPFAGNDTA